MGVAQMDDGGRRCALPGCDRTIPTTDGRPERRYCAAAHRAAARQARRAALQAEQRGGAEPLVETLPWLREPAHPARRAAEVAPTDGRVAEPGPATRARDRRRPPGPRGRALAMLGVAGILAGGYAASDSRPEPSPSSVRAAPEGETADAWAQRATVALTSVNRELDVLEQADEEWRQLPESRRAVVPPPVAALEERRSVLQRRRTMLQSQLDAYRSLRQSQQELAVSEQQLRAVEKALVDAPPERRRSAEQEAAIAALDEQRDLRLRRRDAQREELESLQEGVSTATRTPLPDDDEATTKVGQDVREMVRNGGTTPTAPVDPSPPRPDVVAGREEDDGKPREEVGTSGPPDPRGPRDESEERRAGREESGPPAEPSSGPTAGPGDRPGAGGEADPDPGPAPAPAPAPADEPSVEEERAADTSQETLAELRRRAAAVAREARKAEAAKTAVSRGDAARTGAGSAARAGTPRSSKRARPGEVDRAAVKPSPAPRPRPSDTGADQRRPDREAARRSDQEDRPRSPPAARRPRPTTLPAEKIATHGRRPSPRKRGRSDQRRSGKDPQERDDAEERRSAEDKKHADDEDSDRGGLGFDELGFGRQGPGRQGRRRRGLGRRGRGRGPGRRRLELRRGLRRQAVPMIDPADT